MRKSKFRETQIVGIFAGCRGRCPGRGPIAEARREQGYVSQGRSKYGDASVSDVTRLRELETARLPGGEPLLDRVPFVLRAVREDVIEHLVDGLPDDLQLRKPANVG